MALSVLPTHYYKADAAGLLVDATGNGYTLTNNGTVTTTTGLLNEAWSLNGSSQWLSRAHGAENTFTDKFSVSLWVYATAFSGSNPGIIGKGTFYSSIEWLMYVPTGSPNRLFFIFDPSNYGFISTDPFPSTSTWYHVVAVYDGTQTGNANRLKIWIDGSPLTLSFVGTIPATVPTPGSPTDIAIGRCLGLDYWTGRIDEVAIAAGAWSDADVALLYGSGTPPSYESLLSTAGFRSPFPFFLGLAGLVPAAGGLAFPVISGLSRRIFRPIGVVR